MQPLRGLKLVLVIMWKKISRRVRRALPVKVRMRLLERELAGGRRIYYKKVASRISEIWGIPARELMPSISYGELPVSRRGTRILGQYYPDTHQAVLSAPEYMGHEMMHGFHELLGKRIEQGKWRKGAEFAAELLGAYPKGLQERMMHEIIAETAQKPREGVSRKRISTGVGIKGILMVDVALFFYPLAALILGPKIAARHVEFMMQPGAVRGIYKNHGIDGLILFMVKPPRVFGALETRLWERGMVKRGMLKKHGGFTGSGIEFVRQLLPREAILEKLEAKKRLRYGKT